MALEDRNASQWKWDDIARNITKVILPGFVKVTNVLNDTGKFFAPIDSVKVICDHTERKKQIQTVDRTNADECRYEISKVRNHFGLLH